MGQFMIIVQGTLVKLSLSINCKYGHSIKILNRQFRPFEAVM